MQTIGRRAQSHRFVESWEFVPDALSPRLLEISLHSAAYLESVTTAQIQTNWFVTGDYYLSTRRESRRLRRYQKS